jgi:flavin reductase (DIM6/NTAB) family NADH-FMN oxidoreductase RutF
MTAEDPVLPEWPAATVAILVTAGDRPHAIPVSAVLRAGPRQVLLGLARTRESLARLRARPEVTLAVCAPDIAVSIDGLARVIDEQVVDGVAAVAVSVEAIHDHDRPTFAIDSGVVWRWTDADAAARDETVRAALTRLSGL